MTEPTWRTWQLRDWNKALVSAIFEKRPHANLPITWMDVTPKFLVTVAEASMSEADVVRDAFLDHFRKQRGSLFRLSLIPSQWSPNSAELPFFAYLYLSLLAASADEDTHDEGNFRNRLGKMLGSQSGAKYEPYELADLWRKARQWSVDTSRPRTRKLLLPDPGSETRIGYSKGLAFPGFKDFNALAHVLAQQQLNSESPLRHILSAIASSSWKFSDRFRDEFRSFLNLVSSGARTEMFSSALWSAIADADWGRPIPSKGVIRSVKIQLELIPADLDDDAYLLLLSAGSPPSLEGWKQTVIPRPILEYDRVLTPSHLDTDRTANPIDRLLEGAAAQKSFARIDSNLVRRIQEKLLVFSQDDFGRWIETTSLTDVPKYWLVLHASLKDTLDRIDHRVNGQNQSQYPLRDSSSWVLSGPYLASDHREKLLEVFPRHPAFQSYVCQPRIYLLDAIRLTTGVFFKWPVLPKVRAEQAAKISCDASFGGGATVTAFDLEVIGRTPDGNLTFGFPEEHARHIEGAGKIVLSAFADGQTEAFTETQVEIVSECIDCELRNVSDLEDWLLDSPRGQLEPASTELTQPISEWLPANAQPQWTPLERCNSILSSPQWIALGEQSAQWRAFTDGLCGIFGRKAQLGVQDFFDFVAQIWDGSYAQLWLKIEDLQQNGYVRRLYRRRWRGSVFTACPLRISISNGRARLSGLLPTGKRRELRIFAEALNLQCRQAYHSSTDTYGAIEVAGINPEQANELVKMLNIAPADQTNLELMTLPSWDEIFSKPASQAFNGEVSFWAQEETRFVSALQNSPDKIVLERRAFERRQEHFSVIAPGFSWFTNSRLWGFLARKVLSNQPIANFDELGNVMLTGPEMTLPISVSQLVLALGGGLCFRNEVGHIIYTASEIWTPAICLASWKTHGTIEKDLVESYALKRWRFALALKTGRLQGRALTPQQ